MANEQQKSSNTEKLQEQLLALQIQRESLELIQRQRAEAEFDRQSQEIMAARKIGSSALIEEQKRIQGWQQQCPHTKPNGQSALAGQWDHHQDFHFICAYCAKEWLNNEVPGHLRIDSSKIGGPNHV